MIPESTFVSKLAPNPCARLPHVPYLPAGTGSEQHNHNNGNNTVLRASVCQVPRYSISNPHINPTRSDNTTSVFQGHKLWLEEASHLPQSIPVPYSMLPPGNAQGAEGTQGWQGSCHVHTVSQPHASDSTGYMQWAPPLFPGSPWLIGGPCHLHLLCRESPPA